MSLRRPTVSLIINTYNRAPYLRRLLPGLRHLRDADFEVVVVNGPSTDDTLAVLAGYQGAIKLVSCPERNLSRSRNLGIAAAAGDVVAFLDDDALPGDVYWLARYVAVFAADEAGRLGAAGGPVRHGDTSWLEFNAGATDDYGFQVFDASRTGDGRRRPGRWVEGVQGCNCAFRRSALVATGGFDEFFTYYLDETDVCLRLARARFEITNLPDNWIRHYPARSRRNRYDRSWRVITRSDIYFALKNGSGRLPRRLWRTLATAPRKHYAREIREARRSPEVTLGQWTRFMGQWMVGGAAGLWAGLAHPRRLARLTDPPPPFVPFPCARPARRLQVALLSQTVPGQPGYGGVGRYTYDLARGLHERGHEVHLFCAGGDPVRRESLDFVIHGVTAPTAARGLFPDRPLLDRLVAYALALVRRLADLHVGGTVFDVVHASNWDCEAAALIRASTYPTVLMLVSPLAKVVVTERWGLNHDLRSCVLLDRWQIEHADTVCVPSHGVLGDYERLMGVVPGELARLRVVPLGIVPDDVSAPAREGGRRRLLFVGRCERRKGVHTLLAVLPELLAAHPDWECHLVGNDTIPLAEGGTMKARFLDEHRGAPWLDRVVFRGAVGEEELRRHYRECDLFVAPSLFESFGLIYLEAMQHGKAVIGCRTGGIPEVVTDGVEGLLVTPDRPDELRAALARLMGDAELRQRMGEAGARRVREVSHYRAMAARMEAVYIETMDATGEARRATRERRWPRELPLFEPSDLVNFEGPWETREATPGHTYRMGLPGALLRLHARPDSLLRLVALRHPWSGRLHVQVGDLPPRAVDLYKPGQMSLGDVFEVPVPAAHDGPVPVTLRVGTERHPESRGSQVWLQRIEVRGGS